MLRRSLLLGLLALAPLAPAGSDEGFAAPVLPEVRQHLEDGWACVQSDPQTARGHAMAVLVSKDLEIEVVLDRVPRERRTACRAAVDEALETWQAAIGGNVRLIRVEGGAHRGIVVRFQPDVRDKGAAVAGYVNWKRSVVNGVGRVTGDVQVRTTTVDGGAMPARAMRHIVIHEIGHLLGLDDTSRSGDAMGPLDVAHPAAGPTGAEAGTVRRLRAEAEDLLRDAR